MWDVTVLYWICAFIHFYITWKKTNREAKNNRLTNKNLFGSQSNEAKQTLISCLLLWLKIQKLASWPDTLSLCPIPTLNIQINSNLRLCRPVILFILTFRIKMYSVRLLLENPSVMTVYITCFDRRFSLNVSLSRVMSMYRKRGQWRSHEKYLLGTQSNEAEKKFVRRSSFDEMTPSKVMEELNMFLLQQASVHWPARTNQRLMTAAGEKIH